MPQENIDAAGNDSLPQGAAPFLYMQIDQPPGGSGGPTGPTADDSPDTSDTSDAPLTDEPSSGGGSTESPTEPTAPIDQPPGGSGGS